MLSDAEAFWKALEPKVKQTIKNMTQNTVRHERFDVAEAPDGNTIGVKQPFSEQIFKLPYSEAVSKAKVGDTVIVEWRDTLSTAVAVMFGNGKLTEESFPIKAATEDKFGGLKAAPATEEMTEAVGIDRNGYLKTASNIRLKKIWENADTALMDFPAQTIKFAEGTDLSNYTHILIDYLIFNDPMWGSEQSKFLPIDLHSPNEEIGNWRNLMAFSRIGSWVGTRAILQITPNSIVFSDAKAGELSQINKRVVNRWCIPLRIYAIRLGVQNV